MLRVRSLSSENYYGSVTEIGELCYEKRGLSDTPTPCNSTGSSGSLNNSKTPITSPTKALNYDTPTGSAHPRQTRHHHRQKRNPTQKPNPNPVRDTRTATRNQQLQDTYHLPDEISLPTCFVVALAEGRTRVWADRQANACNRNRKCGFTSFSTPIVSHSPLSCQGEF